MRGVSLRGPRLPANRPAGPARPPVVSGSRTSALAARPCGQRLCRRPRDRAGGPYPRTAARRSIATRHSAAHESAAGRARLARGSPARWHPVKTGTTTLPMNRPAADDLHRQPMPPPAFRRERRPPRPLAGQPALLLPAPAYRRRRPGRGQSLARHTICPIRFLDRSSRTSPQCGSARVRAQAPCQALSAPLSATAAAGPWPPLNRTQPGPDLAGQHLAGTGYGPDLCPYRQPGATSCRACRMFPIACYGLTPRCREVKR